MKRKLPLICLVSLVFLLFASVSFALVPGLVMEQNEQNEMMLDNHFTVILPPSSTNNLTANHPSSIIMDTNALSPKIMTTTSDTEPYFKSEKKEIIKVP